MQWDGWLCCLHLWTWSNGLWNTNVVSNNSHQERPPAVVSPLQDDGCMSEHGTHKSKTCHVTMICTLVRGKTCQHQQETSETLVDLQSSRHSTVSLAVKTPKKKNGNTNSFKIPLPPHTFWMQSSSTSKPGEYLVSVIALIEYRWHNLFPHHS